MTTHRDHDLLASINVLTDSLADLGRLSNRQLLERIARAQNRLEQLMSEASDYLNQALDGLDAQMQTLQQRLQGEADELMQAVQAAADAAGDTQAIQAAAGRVKATADLVSGLALPSEVADPQSPAEATPIPDAGDGAGTPATNNPVDNPVDNPVERPVDTPVDSSAGGTGTPDANQSY